MKSSLLNPFLLLCLVCLDTSGSAGETNQIVQNVEAQPLMAQVDRVLAALDYLGSPVARRPYRDPLLALFSSL